MKRSARTLALLLAGSSLSLAAQAGLQIEGLFISASALVTGPDGQTHGNTWFWDSSLSAPITITSSGIQHGGLAAAARQTPDGFFHDQVAFSAGWDAVQGPSMMRAETQFKLSVSTDTPDTPLVLDFHVLGSLVRGSAYYGMGSMTVGSTMMITAGRLGGPLQDQWGFEDRLVLDSSQGSNFVRQSNGADVQGIGLPGDSSSTGWVDMQSRGQVERDDFIGQLNFGLLQPGEVFKLEYSASTWISSAIRYAGSAEAELIDPFSLSGNPPAQLSIQGLTLPMAPVPEPASVLLMMAGLALLAGLARQRPAMLRGHVSPRLSTRPGPAGPSLPLAR